MLSNSALAHLCFRAARAAGAVPAMTNFSVTKAAAATLLNLLSSGGGDGRCGTSYVERRQGRRR